MSFSGDIKRELAGILPEGRHCQLAELAGMAFIVGEKNSEKTKNAGNPDLFSIVRTENEILQRKFFTLYAKAFMMKEIRRFPPEEKTDAGGFSVCPEAFFRAIRHPMLLGRECCRRSFLRGVFLAAGSVSSPEKYYHYEIVCPNMTVAAKVREVLTGFGLDAKVVCRKHSQVVYLKESEQIVQGIGLMGASRAPMELENVRVLHELRGMVNRKVNFEVANVQKSARMAARQVEDIEFIRTHMGISSLPPSLQMMAKVRLEYPNASLSELGSHLEPRIGKSGVNHRLRRLEEIAADLRKKEGK